MLYKTGFTNRTASPGFYLFIYFVFKLIRELITPEKHKLNWVCKHAEHVQVSCCNQADI